MVERGFANFHLAELVRNRTGDYTNQGSALGGLTRLQFRKFRRLLISCMGTGKLRSFTREADSEGQQGTSRSHARVRMEDHQRR